MTETAHRKSKHSYGRDQVIQIIQSVLSKVEHTEEIERDTIFKELKDLQNIIEEARREVGFAKPADINDKHIPTATDELDAVVEATAEATGTIMDCCDVIQEKTPGGLTARSSPGRLQKSMKHVPFRTSPASALQRLLPP